MQLLISNTQIQQRVRELALQIKQEHEDSKCSLPPVLICVLNGAVMFYTDMLKALHEQSIECEVDFIRAKSYQGQDNSEGVIITKELEVELKGKRAYIIEDIVDTGETMFEILMRVGEKNPLSVKVITLLHRDSSPQWVDSLVDYHAFTIQDQWVAGYGLDDKGLKRNYTDVYAL